MVTVRIVSNHPEAADAGSAVTVQIRDTSLADIAHPVVAETIVRFPEDANAPFEVTLEPPSRHAIDHRYNVWVHCDRSGDGNIGAGDLITTQSFPIDLNKDDTLEITLTRV
jgi:uncharacterized lipoprotein YbaY